MPRPAWTLFAYRLIVPDEQFDLFACRENRLHLALRQLELSGRLIARCAEVFCQRARSGKISSAPFSRIADFALRVAMHSAPKEKAFRLPSAPGRSASAGASSTIGATRTLSQGNP